MKFNKFDGTSAQEIMLMKQAIEEALKPSNESKLVRVTVAEPTVIEGPYTGFSLRIPDSYDGQVTAKLNDANTFTFANGTLYQMLDGILSYGASGGTVRSVIFDTPHAIQKFSVLDKIELSTTSPSGMGVEFDIVFHK